MFSWRNNFFFVYINNLWQKAIFLTVLTIRGRQKKSNLFSPLSIYINQHLDIGVTKK